MVEVRTEDAAQAEYDRAIDWYLANSPQTAAGFATAVGRAIDNIRHFPHAFPRYDADHRFTRVGKYPYTIYYQPGDPVVIVAFANHGLPPGYWHGRTDPVT